MSYPNQSSRCGFAFSDQVHHGRWEVDSNSGDERDADPSSSFDLQNIDWHSSAALLRSSESRECI